MATKSNPAGQSSTTGGTSEKNARTTSTGSQMSSKSESAGVMDTAMESGGRIAGEALTKAKEKTSSMLDEQKHNLASGLGTVAQEIRKVGSDLQQSAETNQITDLTARYTGTIAGGIERVSDYLEHHDVQDFVRDVQDFARRHPGIFVGGAFLVGMAATRFLKSGSSSSYTGSTERSRRSTTGSMSSEQQTGRTEMPRSTI